MIRTRRRGRRWRGSKTFWRACRGPYPMSTGSPVSPPPPRSVFLHRLLPYAQLMRLPNAFTAMADIALGALATRALPDQWMPFVLLLLASTCLYCSGMVWNDYLDRKSTRLNSSHLG